MVRHALRDDFKIFLDKKQYAKASGGQEDNDEQKRVSNGTTHRLYSRMQVGSRRNVVFPHHRMWAGSPSQKEDQASFVRSVERFKEVLRQREHRTLFVITCLVRTAEALDAVRNTSWPGPPGRGLCPVPEEGGHELCCVAEVKRLFEELQARAGDFHLDVLYLVLPTVSEASRKPTSNLLYKRGGQSETSSSKQSLAITEMHCMGENSGLNFKEKADTLLFNRIVTQGREFCTVSVDGSGTKGYKDNNSSSASASSRAPSAAKRPAASSASSSSRTEAPVTKANKLRVFKGSWLDKSIRIQQENPKKAGSTAYHRYEAYKKAKTVRQFLQLGAVKGDLHFDMKRGYIAFT